MFCDGVVGDSRGLRGNLNKTLGSWRRLDVLRIYLKIEAIQDFLRHCRVKLSISIIFIGSMFRINF